VSLRLAAQYHCVPVNYDVKAHGDTLVTASEFVLVLAWLLFPPLLLASVALAVMHHRSPGRRVVRTVGAALLLVATSAVLAFAFVAFDFSSWGRFLGVRDVPVMWAPFAFLAVAASFPLAIWWAGRGAQREP
jgi:hypothetical protein